MLDAAWYLTVLGAVKYNAREREAYGYIAPTRCDVLEQHGLTRPWGWWALIGRDALSRWWRVQGIVVATQCPAKAGQKIEAVMKIEVVK